MSTAPIRIDEQRESDVMSGGGTAIYKKLLAIMNDVAYIKKDKRNEFHKYNYASEAAIKEKLHEAMVAHGVVFLPQIVDVTEREIVKMKDGKPSGSETLTTIKTVHRFVDVETGQYVEGQSYGTGIDGADKGLYKAIAGALKYIMTSTFLIATGDDPEDDGKVNSVTAAKKVAEQKLAGMAAGKSYEQVSAETSKAIGDDPEGTEREKLLAAIKDELQAAGLSSMDNRKEYDSVTKDLFGSNKWSLICTTQIGILTIALNKLRAMREEKEKLSVPEGFPSPWSIDGYVKAMNALRARMVRALGADAALEEYTGVLRACGAKSGHSNDEALRSAGPAMKAYKQMLTVALTAEKMWTAEGAR